MSNTLEDACVSMFSNIAQKELKDKEGDYPIMDCTVRYGHFADIERKNLMQDYFG